MIESSRDGVPEAVLDQITSRSSTEPDPKPWQVSLSPPPLKPAGVSQRHFASVLRRNTIPPEVPVSNPDDDDLFSQPTRVTGRVPRALLLDPEVLARHRARRRYGLWTGTMLLAIVGTAGVVRATDIDRDPVVALPAALPVTPTEPTLLTPEVDHGGIVGDGPCRLFVHATPAGATVFLDGTEAGLTPVTLATSCASHRVDISDPTHAPMTVLAALVEGKPDLIDVTLSARIDNVSVRTRPAGATIFIDGHAVGRTPRQIGVLGHVPVTVELRKPGYRTAYAQLNTVTERNTLTVALRRARARSSDPYASR